MNQAIVDMVLKYNCKTEADYKNALKEILQELMLLGLWRSKFFEHAAFYGGTALRILFGLDRFSEDLDFSLLEPNPTFSLKPYEDSIKRELQSFGFTVSIKEKNKTVKSQVVSAFLKANTAQHLIEIGLKSRFHHLDSIRIKFEVDTDPPPDFETTAHYLLKPLPFSVKVYAEPDLFAGKLHAVLCRSWKTRVKGRDWYDFVWFVSRNTPVHLKHLESRMRQSGHCLSKSNLTLQILKQLIFEKIESIDLEQAKADIRPYLLDSSSIEVWSPDFFKSIVGRLSAE